MSFAAAFGSASTLDGKGSRGALITMSKANKGKVNNHAGWTREGAA
jgi:hypothetical protein